MVLGKKRGDKTGTSTILKFQASCFYIPRKISNTYNQLNALSEEVAAELERCLGIASSSRNLDASSHLDILICSSTPFISWFLLCVRTQIYVRGDCQLENLREQTIGLKLTIQDLVFSLLTGIRSPQPMGLRKP